MGIPVDGTAQVLGRQPGRPAQLRQRCADHVPGAAGAAEQPEPEFVVNPVEAGAVYQQLQMLAPACGDIATAVAAGVLGVDDGGVGQQGALGVAWRAA